MSTLSGTWRRGLAISSLCLGAALVGTALGPAVAQNTAKITASPSAIAVVDMTKVINGLSEGSVAKQKLKDQVDAYTKRLDELKGRLKKVNDDLELLKDKKDNPDFLQKLAEKVEIEATLKARAEALQQIIDLNEGETVRSMYLKITEAAARVGKEAGYDLVLVDDRYIEPPVNKTGAQVTSVIRDRRIIFASDRVDITQQVINTMNNEFKVGKK